MTDFHFREHGFYCKSTMDQDDWTAFDKDGADAALYFLTDCQEGDEWVFYLKNEMVFSLTTENRDFNPHDNGFVLLH